MAMSCAPGPTLSEALDSLWAENLCKHAACSKAPACYPNEGLLSMRGPAYPSSLPTEPGPLTKCSWRTPENLRTAGWTLRLQPSRTLPAWGLGGGTSGALTPPAFQKPPTRLLGTPLPLQSLIPVPSFCVFRLPGLFQASVMLFRQNMLRQLAWS